MSNGDNIHEMTFRLLVSYHTETRVYVGFVIGNWGHVGFMIGNRGHVGVVIGNWDHVGFLIARKHGFMWGLYNTLYVNNG